MKLEFLGTRGYIDVRTSRHRMHASCRVSAGAGGVMIDCGEDWLGHIERANPSAIFITHGHPDHAWGLKEGAPCPVYASKPTWENMRTFPIEERRVLAPFTPVTVESVTMEAHPVQHSTRAPAVGYRVSVRGVDVFYVPDLVFILDRARALQGARLYIGDGATLVRSMVRKPGNELIGHTPMRTQLTWCEKEGVPRAIFSHLGTEVVGGDEKVLLARLKEMAAERGVEAEFAHDGMVVEL
jgi:phosphoribosyl 1,2-cyclic phosphodiesterase